MMIDKLRLLAGAAVLGALLGASHPARAEGTPALKTSNDKVAMAGAAMLGTGYVPVFAMGSASLVHAIANFTPVCGGGGLVGFGRCPENDAVFLMIPIVGPMLYAHPTTGDDLFRRDRGPSATEQVFLYSSSALQLAGVVTTIVGLTTARGSEARTSDRTMIAPMTTAGANGLLVARAF